MIRVACIGAGYFAQFHHNSWARMADVDVVGVCDLELSRAQASGAPAYDNFTHMLDETRPDIVDIILPPAAHTATIRSVLDAGIKTLICQKPFCISLDEARSMTDLAEEYGAQIIVHENFRFQPWYRAIKTALADGMIGDVHQLTFRLRPGDGQGPDAYLARQPYFQTMPRFLIHETGVHWVDVFRYLLGDPISIYADLRRINPAIAGEDAGYVISDHPNGVRALFDGNRHLDYSAQNHRCTMGEALIEGTKGTLSLHGDGSVQLRAFAKTTPRTILAPTATKGFGGDCVHALQSHVIAAYRDQIPFENCAQDYLKVIEIENAIYESAETGRKIALTL